MDFWNIPNNPDRADYTLTKKVGKISDNEKMQIIIL